MKYDLSTYTGQNADFYIQCKGNNSGRPLATPKVNSFAVKTENPILKEVVQALFLGRYFEPYIIGSVIPYIRKQSIEEVIEQGIRNHKPEHLPKLKAVASIDHLILHNTEQIKTLKNYKVAICRSLFNL